MEFAVSSFAILARADLAVLIGIFSLILSLILSLAQLARARRK